MAEIKELLSSADMDCVARGGAAPRRARPAHLPRQGKMDELRTAVERSAATVAVCEDDLSPGQVAAVLDALDVDVLDRTELILTVFSNHAHSLEGTLQVHLAQLEYELTRMRGKGHVLSRLGAGVDMRGPGETKLEVDRRVVRKRIQTLRGRIDHMAQARAARSAPGACASAVPLIALAGYTNAGKSTLLNALTTPTCPCATACSRRSTRRRAPTATATATTWSPTRWASSASCRTSSSTPSPRRWRRRRWPTSCWSWRTPAWSRPRSPCASRPWPTCSTRSARTRRASWCSTRSTCSTRAASRD